MLYSILLAAFAFFLFLLIHVVIFHMYPPKRRFRTLVYLALVCLMAYSILFFLGYGMVRGKILPGVTDRMLDLAGGLFFYFFICFAYFHQIIVFDRSVTPRMMVEVETSPNKRLTKEGLKSRYSLEDKFKKELVDMDFMKRIELKDGKYSNTEKGRHHAGLMRFLRDYLNVGGHQ